MTYSRARLSILSVFLLSLTLIIVLLFVARFKDLLYDDSLTKLIVKTLQTYSIHVAVIFVSAFTSPPKKETHRTALFFAALILSIFWNLLLLFRIIIYTFSNSDDVADVINYFDVVSSNSAFLIAGVLALYFSKENGS